MSALSLAPSFLVVKSVARVASIHLLLGREMTGLVAKTTSWDKGEEEGRGTNGHPVNAVEIAIEGAIEQ